MVTSIYFCTGITLLMRLATTLCYHLTEEFDLEPERESLSFPLGSAVLDQRVLLTPAPYLLSAALGK